jgi:hypothetical protein
MLRALVVLSVLVPCSLAHAFQADLIPLRIDATTEDLEGSVAITGEDGHIRAVVEGVNDDKGEPLDGTATLQLRLKVDGRGRRVALPVVLDTGDGEAETSLNLVPGARIIVRGVRLRAPSGRTIATAGMLVEPQPRALPTTTTTTLPLTPDNCPASLTACQAALTATETELGLCIEELEICEELD